MREIGFGFGSNVGDKVGNLRRAMARHIRRAGDRLRHRLLDLADRAHGAISTRTGSPTPARSAERTLGPEQALSFTQSVEEELGREETFRWGPRVIDVDILYLGDEKVASDRLIVPHKEMFNRAFVLTPLAEIRPDLVLDGRSIRRSRGELRRPRLFAALAAMAAGRSVS